MSALTFPDITPPMTPEVQPEDVGITSPMEDGSVISRARFTRSRLTFYLSWGFRNPLTSEEQLILMDFYQNQAKGSSQVFEWACDSPFSSYFGQTFVVRFIGEPPQFRMEAPGYWSTRAIIQEI